MLTSPPSQPRPLLAIVLLFTVPFIVGALIAPFVFNGLRHLGTMTDALPKLTDAPFERVASRCVTLCAAILLYPLARRTGMIPVIQQGLRFSSARIRELGAGLVLGVISMSVVYLAGYACDVLYINPKLPGLPQLLGRVSGFIVGALFIGLMEEVFFRGLVFSAMRQKMGLFTAMVTSSLIFSALHFFRPRYPVTIEVAAWSDGLALIPHMFELFVWPRDVIFASTLFFMGLTLCINYHTSGSLYRIIGLHSGWVFILLTGSYLFNIDASVKPILFGHSDKLARGVLATMIMVLFFAVSSIRHRTQIRTGTSAAEI